jgi:subtilase family serine protease
MRRSVLAAVSAAAAVLVSSVALATSAGAVPPPNAGAAPPAQPALTHRNVHVCAGPVAGSVSCNAIRHEALDRNGKPVQNPKPVGYGPSDLQQAYGLSASSGSGKTVAIVDAYDDPNAEADLATYRAQFGLPACTSASASRCFTKLDQNGNQSYPAVSASWGQEISLDLDMVSAACPACNILLVEANSPSFSDLAAAVDTAARFGAVAISNSYGGGDSNDPTIVPSYQHAGVAITASSGDSGYGVQSPASFPGVVGVGGTSLSRSGKVYSETAWSGAGSGCSTLNAKPDYQDAGVTGCQNGKAVADVSAVADPNTGVAVYDSYAYHGQSGWLEFGGTSAASPIIASVYAQGPSTAGAIGGAADYTWTNWSGNLHDVTSGSNGTCTTAQWCKAGTGWDGPTGLGTPKGAGAF